TAPGTPEVQQHNLTLQFVQADLLTITQLCRELRSKVLARPRWISEEFADLTFLRRVLVLRQCRGERFHSFLVFTFLQQHDSKIKLALRARRIGCDRRFECG